MYKVISPTSDNDLKKYYHLRWKVLREPWNQEVGSEKDNLDDASIHRMAVFNDKVIAVGRLHFLDKTTAQIRYMAVDKEFEKQGAGKAVYFALEEEARKKNINLIILNARESAIGFYEKLGFTIKKKTYVLFNEIQHYEMHKHL